MAPKPDGFSAIRRRDVRMDPRRVRKSAAPVPALPRAWLTIVCRTTSTSCADELHRSTVGRLLSKPARGQRLPIDAAFPHKPLYLNRSQDGRARCCAERNPLLSIGYHRVVSLETREVTMAGFFVQLIKRVVEKEDVFTECLAAALRDDPGLARRFVLRLCGDNVDGVDVRTAAVDVATQLGFRASTDAPACCLDMILTLGESTRIGVENKLFADEGRSPEGIRDQLRNYLKLPLNRVAYIRAQDAEIAGDVLSHPKYLTHADRHHFLWSDFYPGVEGSVGAGRALTKDLLDLFLHYGFEPPKPEIGDLKDPDKTVAEANRRNFAKLWETTRAELKKMGWTSISPGSIAELYVDGGPSKRIKKAWIDPTWSRGLLRVRLTPYPAKATEVEEALRTVFLPDYDDADIERGLAPKRVRDPEYVQVTISLRKLLGETTDVEAMKRLLAEFVAVVFQEAG
jgi:hypothetical protein